MTPTVSWLVPVHDAEETLACALRSVQRQTFTDWECVVVDDGSRDGSRDLVRELGARDPRFRSLPIARAGIVAALTAGLAECRGRYVARLDADDIAHRERLALQLRAFVADPELVAVGSHVKMFPRAGLSDGLRAYERWLASIVSSDDVKREAFVESPLVHPTLLVRRESLQDFGYRDRGWPEDYDLILRWLGRGMRLGVVPRRLVGWRDGPSRLTRTAAACKGDRIVACKAEHLAQGFLAGADQYVLWGYGDTGRTLCRALAEHGKRPSHIVELHPGRIGQRIAGASVIAPTELPHLPKRAIVASVAGKIPRGEIREALSKMGFVELRDFVCAA
jgi:glycosyltransferase involved in cell wall biosynthesis